jgi:hypothetical protein
MSRTGRALTLTFENPCSRVDRRRGQGAAGAADLLRRQDPHPGLHRHAAPKLKDAILNHHVLVGMSTDMVLFAKGSRRKQVARDGRPDALRGVDLRQAAQREVDFVRINGNRVIRVEIAKVGETPVIFTKDEVEGLMRTDGTPLELM